MASSQLGGDHQKYLKVLRRHRGLLVSQLPHLEVLLEDRTLKPHFTGYECSQVLTQRVHSEQAEKFLDIMEFKSHDAYMDFLVALRPLNPSLTVRLEGAEREVSGGPAISSSTTSPQHLLSNREHALVNGREAGSPRERENQQRVVEDAGIYGLGERGNGPDYHLSNLGYSGREFLASKLNGNPPQRLVFHDFCNALGVDNRLIQASARSRNPTAYLIQTYSSSPEATFERLEQALTQIGRNDIYQELSDMMQNGEFDNDDEM